MSKKKKNKNNSIPKCKRINREKRLESAKNWLQNYEGKKIVRGYRKKYGVDLKCAITELETLGIEFDKNYKEQVFKTIEKNIEIKRQKKLKKELESINLEDMNWDYYFIAGYTSGGVPYGITWEDSDLNEEEIKYYKDLLAKTEELHFKQ